MAIRAPWKGWLRTAMPILTFLILLNTLIVLVLAVVNVAALDLQYDDATPDYIKKHPVSIRVTLLFFWCMIPLFLFFTSIAENWCLWTDRLGAPYVILSSIGAIGLWALQLGLWESCIGNAVAGYCPYVYQRGGWGRYPEWAFSSPRGAGYAVPTLFILYVVQIWFATGVYRRQQRQSFRKSDMSQTWIRRLEDGDSQYRLVAHPLEDIASPNTPDVERRLTDYTEERSSEETATPGRSRGNTITSNWLTPLEPAAARVSSSSRRSTVSSMTDTTTPTTSERSYPTVSERSYPPLTDWSHGQRRRSSSLTRYYSGYSVSEISESERNHATPGSRPSEEQQPEGRRRSSSGLRDIYLVRTIDNLGQRTRTSIGGKSPGGA